MTLAEFAMVVGADPKWIHNTSRLLGRRFRRTVEEARWLRLVRLFQDTFDMSLAGAGTLATLALVREDASTPSVIAAAPDGGAQVVIDRERLESSFAAALAAARAFAGPRQRGRRPLRRGGDPIAAARAYGVDTGLLRSSLALTPAERLERLDQNAQFLNAVHRVNQGRTS